MSILLDPKLQFPKPSFEYLGGLTHWHLDQTRTSQVGLKRAIINYVDIKEKGDSKKSQKCLKINRKGLTRLKLVQNQEKQTKNVVKMTKDVPEIEIKSKIDRKLTEN